MTITTATAAPALAEGVPFSERTRFVLETHPALIEALEKASQEFYLHDPAWQEKCSRHQLNHGMPRRPVESRYGKALNEASAAVVGAFEAMLAAGEVTYAGYPSGDLGGDPTPIPIALLGSKRPRGSRVRIRGVEFFDVKLYLAADLAVAEVETA